MHCSSFEIEGSCVDGGEILVAIATLVTEGRVPGKSTLKPPGFYEGPHCKISKAATDHTCSSTDPLCSKYEKVRLEVLELWQKRIPLCVEVVLTPACLCKNETELGNSSTLVESPDTSDSGILLEQWLINIIHRRIHDKTCITVPQLMNAIRSQLHFSQISSWLSVHENVTKISKGSITYRLCAPGETFEVSQFTSTAVKHDFPATDIGNGLAMQISLLSLPRLLEVPTVRCSRCEPILSIPFHKIHISGGKRSPQRSVLDDRMHTSCTLKGKHRCEDFDEPECGLRREFSKFKRVCQANCSQPTTSKLKPSTDHRKGSLYQLSGAHLNVEQNTKNLKLDLAANNERMVSTAQASVTENDLSRPPTKGDILLNAILRSCQTKNADAIQSSSTNSTKSNVLSKNMALHLYQSKDGSEDDKKVRCDFKCVQKLGHANRPSSISANMTMCGDANTNNNPCDNSNLNGDIFNVKDRTVCNSFYINKHCDSPVPKIKHKKVRDVLNATANMGKCRVRQKLTFSEEDDVKSAQLFQEETLHNDEIHSNLVFISGKAGIDIPSAIEQAKFRKSLGNATSMVFHSRTGLPLTSSPAPVRRGKSCFDFDSSINSVSAIGNALFSQTSDDESESDGSIMSPCSPDSYTLPKREPLPVKYCRRRHPNSLLGTFEESVLNGRLEPVSTVHGFTAELGASGSFVPKHLVVPVTVFFYNLGDNEKVSSPYLGHINLGRKGYQVPRSGTVQVTLFNPLGTVVKMFVIMYDLSEMPPNTQTFIRQRTLYMPTDCQDKNLEWGPKWLRYLIHLRFMSSKSGRIYLHSDIRMIIFRKSDLDTATALGIDMSYELRSFTHMPTNPQFSSRK